MKNSTVALLGVAVVVLAGLALRESWSARQARTARDVAVQERDGLRDRVAQLEKEQQALQIENAGLHTAAATTRPTGERMPSMKPFTAAAPRGRVPPPFAAFDSPEMRQLMAIEQKGRLDARYAALFRALHLPPEKLADLKKLLVDKQNAMMDVLAAAHRQDLFDPANGADVPGLIKREQDLIDSGIRELLGETAYEEYQDYERTRAQRGVVDQLSSRLSYSGDPLTAQQAEALVDLLSAERSTRPAAADPTEQNVGVRVAVGASSGNTMVAFGPGGLSGDSAPITDASLAGAQSVLNEAQLAALRQLQAEQLAQQQMSELLRRSMPMPPGGPGTTATWVAAPTTDPTTAGVRPP
jgi:hypothetical protein